MGLENAVLFPMVRRVCFMSVQLLVWANVFQGTNVVLLQSSSRPTSVQCTD
jgi:hypothetical protein